MVLKSTLYCSSSESIWTPFVELKLARIHPAILIIETFTELSEMKSPVSLSRAVKRIGRVLPDSMLQKP